MGFSVRILSRLIIFLCLAAWHPTQAQDFFVVNNKGILQKIDLSNCSITDRGNNPSRLTYGDVTFHPNGNFYAITKNSLYEMDTITGYANHFYDFKTSADALNAMTTAVDGTIYAASTSGELISFNIKTRVEKNLGRIGAVGRYFTGATGDLTFYKGELYMVAFENLLRVNISNPLYSTAILKFPKEDLPIFGLVGFADCKGTRTFALTSEPKSRIFEIDWNTLTVHQVCTINTEVFGAGSRYDLFSSLPLPDTTYLKDTTCIKPLVGTRTRDAFRSSRGCDSITYTDHFLHVDTVHINSFICHTVNTTYDTIYSAKPNACDTLFYRRIMTAPILSDTVRTTQQFCDGNILMLNGKTISKSGIYQILSVNRYGCDSTTFLTVHINPRQLDTTVIRKNLCGYDSFRFVDQYLSKPGSYRRVLQNISGCDSLLLLTLGVSSKDTFTENRVSCDLKKTGTFVYINVDQFGCDSIVKTIVKSYKNPNLQVTLPDNLKLNVGDSIALAPTVNFNPFYVHWYRPEDVSCDTCLNTFAKPIFSSVLRFVATDSSNCNAEADINILVNRTRQIFIPTAFSPNGDGVNDFFTVSGDKQFDFVRTCYISDRWGNIVFAKENNKQEILWDGIFNGREAPGGVYIYYVVVHFRDGEEITYRGDVSVLR